MVDVYRTEEEQIEAIKKWWKKDGLSTILMVIVIAAAYYGWQWWQGQQLASAQALSVTYEELLQVDQDNAGDSEKALELAAPLIASLRESGASYGIYAAQLEAKYYVETGDLAKAEETLNWALEQKPEAAVADITRLRLARVQYALGNYDAALASLVFEETSAWDAISYELQGDIEMALGQVSQAEVSYEKAVAVAEGSFGTRYIEMKLNKAKSANSVVAANE